MDAYKIADAIAKVLAGRDIHRASIRKIVRESIMEGIKPYEARIAELEAQLDKLGLPYGVCLHCGSKLDQGSCKKCD